MSEVADVNSMFAGPGKTYHGVRYPNNGTIRPPFCVVTVLPEDGQPYELRPADGYEWGEFFRNLPKLEEPRQRNLYEKKATYMAEKAKQSKADIKRLERHQKACRNLALTILADLTNLDIAWACADELNRKVISKLPEAEWRLTTQQIQDAVGVSIVLAGLSGIKG